MRGVIRVDAITDARIVGAPAAVENEVGKVRCCASGDKRRSTAKRVADDAQSRAIRLRREAAVSDDLIESLVQLSRSISERPGPGMERGDNDEPMSRQRGNQIALIEGASATTVTV